MRYLSPEYWSDRRTRHRIDEVCIGYSTRSHWEFFRSDQGTGGVARAVRVAFERFAVHADWIWWASPAAYRPVN